MCFDLPIYYLRNRNYNTKTKKNEDKNITSVGITNLESKFLDGFSSVKDEEINLKDFIIRKLQEEISKFRSRVEFNYVEQYVRHTNTELSGIPDSVGDNGLECLVIIIMKAIDIEIDDRYREVFHRKEKSKWNS